jgi:methionine aminopeptidase
MSAQITDRLYYYVSIAYYSHTVYKCCGHGAEDAKHRAFYVPHFEQHGTGNSPADKGPATVHVLPFIADRITFNDTTPVPFND